MVTTFESCEFSHDNLRAVSPFLLVVEWIVLLTVTLSTVLAQGHATLHGSIIDESGASIVHAALTLVDSNGMERKTTTGSDGTYLYNNLSPGKYEVRVNAQGFGQSESEVEIGRSEVEHTRPP